MKPVPVSTPVIGEAERTAVLQCLDSGWLSAEGPQVQEFERAFAGAYRRAHGVAVSSGTAALDIAVRALGLGAGDQVLVPSLTIISCARAIVESGATPVPVDCDGADWNATLADFERRLTPRTRAVMLVHLYGLCADLDPILEWAAARGLIVIEDASQAQGLLYNGRPCGSFGEIGAFSLYANKLITTGEGGMVLCDSSPLAERCRSLRSLCFDNAKRFWHEDFGWNYRMTAPQAAIGIPQVHRMNELVTRKRAIGDRYREAFAHLNCFEMAPAQRPYVTNCYWVFALVIKPDVSFTREALMTALSEEQIASRTFFYGLHEQPVLLRRGLIEPVTLPITESLSRRGLYLPSGPGLPQADQDRVIESVTRFVESRL